jgi:hypothetical protein
MNRRAIRGPFLLNPSVHGGFDVWGRRKWFTGTRRSCDHRYGSQDSNHTFESGSH